MIAYGIYREPGPAATRNTIWTPRPKRVGTVVASGQLEALGDYVHDTYLATGKQSYGGHRFEWRTTRNLSSKWKPWNGEDDPGTRGREWSVVVTLRNGDVEHEARLVAWRRES